MQYLKRQGLVSVAFGQHSRGVRTRTPIKIDLTKGKNKKGAIDIQDKDPGVPVSDGKVERSRFSRFSGTSPSHSFTSTPSSSSRNNEYLNEVMQEMKFKKPQDIVNELTARFKQDGVEVDTDFINRMVQESAKEQELVSEYIKDPSMTLSKVSEEEINRYIDWLIEDGKSRISDQHRDTYREKVEIRKKLDEFMTSDENETGSDPEAMTKAFAMAQELSVMDSKSSLNKLPLFLKHLTKMSNVDLQSSVPLEKYAALYELSTQIVDSDRRERCIYLCGKLLYQALRRDLGPRARPDPVNEKFFIESCIRYNDLDRAFFLYDTRKEKDVKNERFWFELGVCIHLSRYFNESISLPDNAGENNKNENQMENEDLSKAIDLVHDIRDRWGYVNNLTLIDALKKCCMKENFDDAFWFWEDIEINIQNLGIVKEIVVPETRLYDDKDREQVYNYYNRTEPISYDGILECIFSFIGGLQFERGVQMLKNVVEIDEEFIYEFVRRFGEQFKYSGRELFLITLEENSRVNYPSSHKLSTEIRDYLIEEISTLQKTRCVSYNEAKIVEDINIYLERLAKLKSKHLSKINDLQEIIQSGEKLTSFDVRSLLEILLQHKSAASFQLACRLIGQMNEHKSNGVVDSILPVANSYAYTEFCKLFLIQSNPRVKEINDLLQMMVDYDIKMEQELANKIILSFISKKLYSEAIKFIETYVFSDNPIAVNHIRLGKPGTKNLWTTLFCAYYKSVVSGTLTGDLFSLRLNSLRSLMKKMMEQEVDDNFTIQEAVGTLLAYGDFPGSICLIQWYGKLVGEKNIKFDFVLAIKTKFELSISKAERYLKHTGKAAHQYEQKIKQYRHHFGVQSLHDDFKTRRDFSWQEVAMVLYKYAELFCYKSTYTKEDPFSLLLPDSERYHNKAVFETNLSGLQRFYNLPEWKP